jgi:hypothetical protein
MSTPVLIRSFEVHIRSNRTLTLLAICKEDLTGAITILSMVYNLGTPKFSMQIDQFNAQYKLTANHLPLSSVKATKIHMAIEASAT